LPKEDPDPAVAFESLFDGRILAGPIYKPGAGIEVVVALEHKGAYSGYTGDCILFEVTPSGEPYTRTPLPQEVTPLSPKLVNDGAVWVTQNRGLMRTRIVSHEGFGRGPGGPDATGEIAWLTQPPKYAAEHWLSTDAPYDSIAFGDGFAIRANKGWYADAEDRSVVFAPLDRVDLSDGSSKPLLLKIKLSKPLTLPTENVSSYGKYSHAIGPYGIGVTHLDLVDKKLRVFIASTKDVSYVDFRLP
jgi:hypothetical protein